MIDLKLCAYDAYNGIPTTLECVSYDPVINIMKKGVPMFIT